MHPRCESAEAESFLVVGLATRPEIHIDHIGDILNVYIRIYIILSYYLFYILHIGYLYFYRERDLYVYMYIYIYIYMCVCEIMKPSINLIIYYYSI